MSSLVSVNPTEGKIVVNSAFWPSINTADMCDAVRLDGQVTESRLLHATTEAMARVNRELRDWQFIQQAAGYTELSEIPAEVIDDQSVLAMRYRRAVYCTAKALLLEGYRDIDTTREGEKHAEALNTQIESVWRDSQWALRDIMGLRRSLAEIV